MYNVARLSGLVALVSLAAAAWFSVRLARADAGFREGTPEGVARALELAPRNTAYLSLRALQVDYDGGDPRPLLESIARLTPDASAPRIRLGLDAEVRGDLAGAERWLLDAARVDRQYEPRWTLANFYFRQQKMDDFWKWMRAALDVSYGDRVAAFDLAWAAAPATQTILSRAIPDRREVLAAFLTYLLSGHKDALPVAERLSQFHDPADSPAPYHGDGPATGATAAARSGPSNLDQSRLPRSHCPGLLNPDFGPPRVGHGFDWRLAQNPGVTHVSLDTPPAHRILFSGKQPESCELLRQYVGIRPGRATSCAGNRAASAAGSPGALALSPRRSVPARSVPATTGPPGNSPSLRRKTPAHSPSSTIAPSESRAPKVRSSCATS